MFLRKEGETKLSTNFKAKEFFCKCGRCEEQLISYELVEKLQRIREEVGSPIHINCGYRCKEHNKKVGGVKSSQHLLGNAADITMKMLSIPVLAKLAEDAGFNGIGAYSNFLHVDVREHKRRWKG